MKVKLRSPLDPHHTQMPGYLFQMCHTSFSFPCNPPMRMLLQRKFAAVNDIPEIGFSRKSEQYKKFIPHILFGSDVPMMQISSKKREYSFLICSF